MKIKTFGRSERLLGQPKLQEKSPKPLEQWHGACSSRGRNNRLGQYNPHREVARMLGPRSHDMSMRSPDDMGLDDLSRLVGDFGSLEAGFWEPWGALLEI
ncbi:hypothetical protein L6452_09616 [Arctium lappa]|uniref:Uncharacterized protein n=1 Tax=Arctium lappa TaxID=4217 RepID=A0ACB9DKV5_ARCLA|nr:hypothetical protein L6452_09616 [Arctium lappa]